MVKMRPLFLGCAALALLLHSAEAAELKLSPTQVEEWKSVFGRVEARNTVPARARLGGTLVQLKVSEGDEVEAGQIMATVRDEKLAFQIGGIDAQIKALKSQLAAAQSERDRGRKLLQGGISTKQRQETLDTQVDVLNNQIAAALAQRKVLEQQGAEGDVIAPAAGRVITVPVTQGSVIMPGEAVATLASGGFFLRLAIPERHASLLKQGASLEVETDAGSANGTLVKIYPEINNGRVVADVEVDGLPANYVNARVLVRVPIGRRNALLVPAGAISTRSGLDFATVKDAGGTQERLVTLGERVGDSAEVLTGLSAGDVVLLP